MPDRPEFLILRHGETEWNRIGRMQGGLDSPLTEIGRAQAAAQHQILERFGVSGWSWVCSPQGRAVETASIAAKGLATEVVRDPRLVEIRLGRWDGMMREDIRAEAPHLFDDPDSMIWYDNAPGGEGLLGLEARAKAFLSTVTCPTVVITHGITSRVLRCLLLGMDVMEFEQMPGGQGVVYHVKNGTQKQLSLGA